MLRVALVSLMSILCVCSSAIELRADIVDQQQLDAATTLSAADGGFYNVQSFQQTNNNITGASVAVRNVPVGTPITIRLYDMFADTSNPVLALAQGTVTTTTSSLTPQFETVSFAGGPISVTSGQTMYLVFEKATGAGNTVQGAQGSGGFQGTTTNLYPNGQLFAEGNGSGALANFDYAFETFAVDPNEVPEPSSVVIVGLGLALVATRRRRKPRLVVGQ